MARKYGEIGDASKVLVAGGDGSNLYYFYTLGSTYDGNTIENIAAFAQEHFDSCKGKSVEEIKDYHIFWGTDGPWYKGFYNGDTYILFDDVTKLPPGVQEDAVHGCAGYRDRADELLAKPSWQVDRATYDEMLKCGRSYDPYTMYIESYAQEQAANRRNAELDNRFNELMHPFMRGYSDGVPYVIKNCSDTDKQLTLWLDRLHFSVEPIPEKVDFKGMMHELATNVFRDEKTDKSLVSSDGHQLDFHGYPVESRYELFVGGISVREDGHLLYRNDSQCFGSYNFRNYTEGRFKSTDEVADYLSERYAGKSFKEVSTALEPVSEVFERQWKPKRPPVDFSQQKYKQILKIHKNNIKDIGGNKVRVSFYVDSSDQRPAYAYLSAKDVRPFETKGSGKWADNYRAIRFRKDTVDLYRRLSDGSSVKESWTIEDLQKSLDETKSQYKAKLGQQAEASDEAAVETNELEL